MKRSRGFDEHLRRARQHFADLRGPRGRIAAVQRLRVAPGGRLAAFDALVSDGDGGGDSRAAVVDLEDRRTWVAAEGEPSSNPAISLSGAVAWIAGPTASQRLALGGLSEGASLLEEHRSVPLPEGAVEHLEWSPDGSRILLLIAAPGASLSDAHGSGRIAGGGVPPTESWRPVVDSGRAEDARRSLHLVEVPTGRRSVLAEHWNAWEACWLGPEAVLCIASEAADESAWYGANLVELGIHGGERRIETPQLQLARPAANPAGTRLSVISGVMSDRGIDAGELLVRDRDGARWQTLALDGGDATDQSWLDDGALLVAELRGLMTAVSRVSCDGTSVQALWESEETCGDDLVPRAGGSSDAVVIVRGSYLRAPSLARLRDGRAETLIDLAPPGAARAVARAGSHETVAWYAADGTRIEGFLVLPEGEGPHPLVVEVHGGPVYAHRNTWMGGDSNAPLYAQAGYAVFMPNIRGSIGRGARFVAEGVFDMCGDRDVDDLLSGIRELVQRGRADPRRIAVTGLSYGGLLSAWLSTEGEVFAAAIPRSPVTEWVSQHFASNLPGFDRLMLSGDPLDPGSQYRLRSPLYRADRVSMPVLNIAGSEDLATPPEQAVMFHRAAREHGAHSELVIYPEEGHGVQHPEAMIDHAARILDFLDRVLPRKAGGAATPSTSV